MSSRKQNLMGGVPQIQPFTSTFRDSWEEQAFAEDSAGALGSYIWPPRSYTCSFCRREFRSAQALGGHMNVHRRDRARLKQLPTTSAFVESTTHLHHNNNNNFRSYPSQSCLVMRNSNPNHGVVPQPRVSMVSNQESCGELIKPTYISPSIIQESSKHLLWSSSSPSQSRTLSNTTLGLKIEGDSLKLKEMIGKRQRDFASKEEDKEEMGKSKRQRIAYASINFLDLDDPEEDCQCSEVIINHNRDPVEDIDLELRLGHSRN